MKRIFEFDTHKIMNDPKSYEFLQKVKKENPDLYAKFVSIVGNKGLEVAIEKYKDYEPYAIKQKKAKEKSEERRSAKEEKEKENLEKYKPIIDEIEKILWHSKIDDVDLFIDRNAKIKEYLKSCGAKREYKNKFREILRNPINLPKKLGYSVVLDVLSYRQKWAANPYDDSPQTVIRIIQTYILKKEYRHFKELNDLKDNDRLKLSISFQMPEVFSSPKEDREKKEEFIFYRNERINKLGGSDLTLEQVYEKLTKFAAWLDPRVYDKWLKEWEFQQTVNKYNL